MKTGAEVHQAKGSFLRLFHSTILFCILARFSFIWKVDSLTCPTLVRPLIPLESPILVVKISSVHWRQQNSWLQVSKKKQTKQKQNCLDEGKPYPSVNVNLLLNQWNYFHHCRQFDAFHAVLRNKTIHHFLLK